MTTAKLYRTLKYNTHNTAQGPTISRGSLHSILKCSEKEFQKSIDTLKDQDRIFELRRNGSVEYTLQEESRLVALQEQEAGKENPSKDLIGHINKMRMELDQ